MVWSPQLDGRWVPGGLVWVLACAWVVLSLVYCDAPGQRAMGHALSVELYTCYRSRHETREV